jgi:DNA gyrase/topoisomerase IV subunit A
VASTRSCIKISVNDIPTLSRVAQGAKAIKMNDTDKIIGISLY